MSIYGTLVVASVAILIAGLWGAGFALYGRATGEGPFRSRATRVRTAGALTMARHRAVRWAVALFGGALVWLGTGWPIGGLLFGVLVMTVPFFFGGAKIAADRIRRLEALEQWVRYLSDSMSAGSMPVQTIVKSAEHAPPAIRVQVTRLATGLATPRLDRNEVLETFADEIDDALGDIVVLALKRAVNARGGERVPQVLQTLAEAVAADVKARRNIEKGRSGPRKETQTIVLFLAVGVGALVAFTNYPSMYSTPEGQVVLAVLGGVALLALGMMRRLSIGGQPPRILTERKGDSA